jgi:hypothetical protein
MGRGGAFFRGLFPFFRHQQQSAAAAAAELSLGLDCSTADKAQKEMKT